MRFLGVGLWRPFFVLASVFLAAGGPQHPAGTMAEMLADPKWVPAHGLMLAGFLSLLAGLIIYHRGVTLPHRTRKWTRWAIVATAVQAVEMALHTAAAIDQAALVAGDPTPILTTHLALSVVAYPVFGVTLAGFIAAGARDQVLGSRWIAWLGILGALGHGAAAPLTVLFRFTWARLLFPLLMLFALWLLVTVFWPVRGTESPLEAGRP